MSSVRLSKFLAKLLRHSATERNLDVSPEGYVNVEDILELSEVNDYSEEDVRNVCTMDSKGRFALRTDPFTTKLQIKATQGHSMKLEELELTPITHSTEFRSVLHATRRRNLELIRQNGLSRMTRTHIHFAQGEQAKSGFPSYTDTLVEVDLKKALRAGIKFYKSENDVILSPGNAEGYVPSRYIKKISDRRTGENLDI